MKEITKLTSLLLALSLLAACNRQYSNNCNGKNGEFQDTIASGDLGKITAFVALEEDFDIDACCMNHRTPLQYFVDAGNQKMVKFFLTHKANPNKKDMIGMTALMTAADNGQVEMVKLLLSEGADPFIANNYGQTARFMAWRKGHQTIVALLQSNQEDIPMAEAAIEEAEQPAKIIKEMIRRDSFSYKNKCLDESNPVAFAFYNKKTDLLALLLDRVECIDLGGTCEIPNLVSWHIIEKNEGIAELLLNRVKDILIHDEVYDISALLLCAVQYNHRSALEFLLDKATKSDSKVSSNALLNMVKVGSEEAVAYLLDKGVDFRFTVESGVTLLMIAAREGHPAVVKLLLDRGADPNRQDEFHYTAFTWAARAKRQENAVRRLLEQKASKQKPQKAPLKQKMSKKKAQKVPPKKKKWFW